MEKPWKVVIAFLVVFVAGAVFGGVFALGVNARRQSTLVRSSPTPAPEPVATVNPPTPNPTATVPVPQPVPKKLVLAGLPAGALSPQLIRQFTQRLELTPGQRQRIRPFIDRASEDILRLRQENLADTARVTERMYEDISATLTPAQRTELEKMRVQMQERVRAEQSKRAEQNKRVEPPAAEGANHAGPETTPVRPKTQRQVQP